MTVPVKTVDADATPEDVATIMVESRANPLPVMENGKLVGILTQADLVRIFEEFEEPAE